MIDTLKWQIRSWEREGKHERVTRVATAFWATLNNLKDRFSIGRVGKRLKRGDFPQTVESAVREVCDDAFGAGIRPMQVPSELAGLIERINVRKPKTILEIGTARGGTLFLMCRFAAPDATIVSVDLPYGRNGGGYPRWKEPYYRDFAQNGQALHLMRADSHDAATVERVREIVGDRGFDFILIDADHSFEGVKKDYQNYRPLLAPGGLLALHDVLENKVDPSIDVNRFWNELEADTDVRTDTIIADETQGMYGIGLVYG